MTRVQISAGVGPVEARRFVALLANQLRARCDVRAVEVHGPADAPRSVELVGEVPQRAWEGIHELVAAHRGRGARRRWFCSIRLLESASIARFDPRDCDVRTCRAGGPGGQHVNRRETAVRVTHRPTGVSVRVEGERSQGANRRAALQRMEQALATRAEDARAAATAARRHAHYEVRRGDADHHWRLDRRGRLQRRP